MSSLDHDWSAPTDTPLTRHIFQCSYHHQQFQDRVQEPKRQQQLLLRRAYCVDVDNGICIIRVEYREEIIIGEACTKYSRNQGGWRTSKLTRNRAMCSGRYLLAFIMQAATVITQILHVT